MDSSTEGCLLADQSSKLKQKANRPPLTTFVFLVLLIIIVLASTVAAIVAFKRNADLKSLHSNSSKAVQVVCSYSQFESNCFNAITAINSPPQTNPEHIFHLSVRVAVNELTNLSSLISQAADVDPITREAFSGCLSLLNESMSQLNKSSMAMNIVWPIETAMPLDKSEKLGNWISDAMLNEKLCLEFLDKANAGWETDEKWTEVRKRVRMSQIHTRNSLAILDNFQAILYRYNEFEFVKNPDYMLVPGLQYSVIIFLLCLLLRI